MEIDAVWSVSRGRPHLCGGLQKRNQCCWARHTSWKKRLELSLQEGVYQEEKGILGRKRSICKGTGV